MSFVQDLRKSIIEKRPFQLWKTDDTQTNDPIEANFISFPPSEERIALTSSSGYKNYSCFTVLFFYANSDKDHPSYLQLCVKLNDEKNQNFDQVAFMDRRDLLDYLNGTSATSAHVSVKLVENNKDFGFDLNLKRSQISAEILADYEHVKRIKAIQRFVNTPANILCIRGTKNFGPIEKPAFAAFLDVKGSGKDIKAVKAPPPKAAHKSDKYIIIVPAAAQSLLTLYNVKEFLIDQKYIELIRFVHPDEIRKQGIKKPLKVELTRDPKKLGPDQASKFIVVDSVETIKPEDWDRVVACFASGQEWQFKGWKYTKPVEIFSHMKGFSLKFQDDPTPGMLNQWNVKQLQVMQH